MGLRDGSSETIYSVEEKCVGCNKCIRSCPVAGANISYAEGSENKVRVDQDLCIRCGACVEACAHDARRYRDDTEAFFRDLAAGKRISVVAAPASRVNFENPKRLIGFLKASGVRLAYDVSFGADITTWAYLKAIKEMGLSSVIAQPCPAVVNYIEKYRPSLIPNLAPIHSPTLCTAVFLRKYAKAEDAVAFLSPCIGKSDEFRDANTGGLVSYNVTYRKLIEYVEERRIDLSSYPEAEYDDMGCWLGCLYSRPGGLRENVEALVSGAWVRQIEGRHHAYPYLAEYEKRRDRRAALPLLVDVLNCSNGCNLGTAARKGVSIDDADEKLNALKAVRNRNRGKAGKRKQAALFGMFDSKLRLEDFRRKYTDRRVARAEPTQAELDLIYGSLHKHTSESRTVDCSACGYETCAEMAAAIHHGYNVKINCIQFNRYEVAEESRSISEKTKLIDELSVYAGAIVDVLDELAALNLDIGLDGAFTGEFEQIQVAINRIIATFNETIYEIRGAAEQFTAGAEQVSGVSAELAAGASEQAAAVEKLSALVGMLAGKTKENAGRADTARKLSSASISAAEDGNRRMADMLKSMDAINEASSNITKILKTIDDIAFQTNILALNAAVEAARAGKFGKGFAVVADEVRNLAVKCSVAAKESAAYIEESTSKMRTGKAIANETAEALANIVGKSAEIAATVEAIAATSNEQASGIDEVSANLRQVERVVASNSSVSQASAATSQELSAQAVSLKRSVSQFNLRSRRRETGR